MNIKKSFVVYYDWISIFENLEDVEAGQLIKHIFRYGSGQTPEPPNRLLKLVFEPIRLQLDRDSDKWIETVEKRSMAGKMGGRPRKVDSEDQNKANALFEKQSKTKKAVNVLVNVPVNENVNDTLIIRENIPTRSQVKETFISIENLEEYMLSDKKWIETVSSQNNFTLVMTKDWIKRYILKLKAENQSEKSSTDCFSHCARWINYEKIKTIKNGNKRSSNNTTDEEFVDAVANGINRAFTGRS